MSDLRTLGNADDAARISGVSARSMIALAASGALPCAEKVRRRWQFDLGALTTWIEQGGSKPIGALHHAVYFIRGDLTQLIKIGCAVEPQSRLRALRVAQSEPLTLLALCPGHVKREREFHQQFAEHRHHGEWFAPAPELLQKMQELNEAYPLPDWAHE